MVTGPVTRNLEIAALKTYRAAPAPKLVVAVGACACSGGICGKNYASAGGVNNILPVDVYIPGCPPRPQALIQGLLKTVGRTVSSRPENSMLATWNSQVFLFPVSNSGNKVNTMFALLWYIRRSSRVLTEKMDTI